MSDFDNKGVRSASTLPAGDPETLDPAMLESDTSGSFEVPFDDTTRKRLENAWHDPAPVSALDGPAPASLAWDDEESKELPDPYLGTTLDRYVIDALLGEGGMGKVYLAHHAIIGKKVAIKILHAELAREKESVGRFVREAKAVSSIGNPHIVDVSDFGEAADGSTYFVMELLDGKSLGQLIDERGAVPPDLIVDIGLQLCDGLAAAHKQQIVHRDLKPDNITLVKQGKSEHFCKILDFGIAKVATSTSSTKLTMAGAIFGTPHYMSPEQAAGDSVDHRTDIYSLGVILYEMAAGELPFNADNFMGILTQHMYKAPVPIRSLAGAPPIPPGLEAIILKSLTKKKEARYQTMDELAEDLRKLKQGQVPAAVHDMMERSGSFDVPADYFKTGDAIIPARARGRRSAPWGPRLVALSGVLVAVGVTLFVLIKDSTTTAQPPEPPAASDTPPPPAPAPIEVVLASEPADATAYIGDRMLALPAIVPVAAGDTVSVKIVAEGFAEREIALDGRQERVVVKLSALAPSPSASSAAPLPAKVPPRVIRPRASTRPPATKPGDVVDPWAGK